jgi:hypothetical protein
MKFWIERSELIGVRGELFLKSDNGHCHGIYSVDYLLQIDRFRKYNEKIVPIFEKALEMMKSNQTGPVEIK